MSRSLLIIALVLAASSLVLGQSTSSSIADLRQSSVRVDLIPVSDELAVQKSPAAKSSSKAGARHRAPDTVSDTDKIEGRFWGSEESLLWKMKRSNLPPLITTGPASSNAVIGEPGTVIAFGGSKLDRGKFPGGRFTVGMWLNEKRNIGVELSYFFLKERTVNFQISSNGQTGSLSISRPFLDAFGNRESVIFVVHPPAFASGSSTAISPSRLRGAEANLIYRLNGSHPDRISLLAGFRYLDLREGLTITDSLGFIGGSHATDTDQFLTYNQFYGGQAGVRSSLGQRRLSLELEVRMAAGDNRERVGINGATFSSGAIPSNFTGGLLAVISNIGQYRRNEFTVVPEMKAKLAYKLTGYLRAFVAYDFLYWNKVVRPSEQIDRAVNQLLIPFVDPALLTGIGPFRPTFTFHDTSFWAQGLNIGIQTRF
jgi:hypothetical protein